jgi:transposase
MAVACVEMGRFYGLPTQGPGVGGDGKYPDYQEGLEGALAGALVALAGADSLVGLGTLDGAQSFSLAKAVLDNDAIAMIRRLAARQSVDAAASLLDDIRAVGVGGHFLGRRSTREASRSVAVWRPNSLNAMKRDLPVACFVCHREATEKEVPAMLYAGLDLSRKRVDVCLLDEGGARVEITAAPPDGDGLRGLADRLAGYGQPIYAALESMNGARFVHDTLEACGWDVALADAFKVKGLAPLTAKTDRIDAYVLAELCRRDLVPAVWLPTPGVRAERERARFRLHLVRHRTALKNRIHASLIAHGHSLPVSDLFGARGRELLARLALPGPWASTTEASLRMIADLDTEIAACEAELHALGADHRYVPLLLSAPGIAWVLAYTIAAEIGEITRFASPKKLCGYSGLCPKVIQSGASDRRGPLTRNGPEHLRWALIEAATHAARHPAYAAHYERTKRRLGRQRGARVARVEIARKLAEAIWYMLSRSQPFAPAGPALPLVA